MKAKLLHEMTTEELKGKLTDLKSELFNLRFRHATGNLANPMLIATTRKDIARVKTIICERELRAKAN